MKKTVSYKIPIGHAWHLNIYRSSGGKIELMLTWHSKEESSHYSELEIDDAIEIFSELLPELKSPKAKK